MKNKEGQRVPEVTFKTRTPEGQWKDVKTSDLFAKKKVVVFSLPGAFPAAKPGINPFSLFKTSLCFI